jgi:hypothetical protein
MGEVAALAQVLRHVEILKWAILSWQKECSVRGIGVNLLHQGLEETILNLSQSAEIQYINPC